MLTFLFYYCGFDLWCISDIIFLIFLMCIVFLFFGYIMYSRSLSYYILDLWMHHIP
ncbi:hypothetical protein GLOIN_2v1512232, partial [Rhizophagus irregularis DAOM 181602=DAOM 197198]